MANTSSDAVSEATPAQNFKNTLPIKDEEDADKPPPGTDCDTIVECSVSNLTDFEKQKTAEGEARFRRLGWKRLTVILVVEAIALGVLSLPSAFATLGMVAGVITCIGLGFVAIYTSYIVGETKMAFPDVHNYGDVGGLLMGRVGEEVFGAMFVLQLVLMTESYCGLGTTAFDTITNNGACSLVFGIVSAILLFLLATMPSFTEAAILGYIDFVSIMSAILLTIIATGVEASQQEGGIGSVSWSAWPKPGITVTDAFIAISNILFAYSFCMYQFSFMDEMHTPEDYIKSVWTLGILKMIVYTLTGALIFAFVGTDVKSPALLSLSPLLTKLAFGIALPVIYISGALNNTVTGRYIHLRLYKDSILRFINTAKGWLSWLTVLAITTITAWVIAEIIPFFSYLLAISSSLFLSGFVLHFPATMWFMLLRKNCTRKSIRLLHDITATLVFIMGIIILVGGTYASVNDVKRQFAEGKTGGVFSCTLID